MELLTYIVPLKKAADLAEAMVRHAEGTGICAALSDDNDPGFAAVAHVHVDDCPFPIDPAYPLPFVLLVAVHPDDRDWLYGDLQEATERAYCARGASFIHGEANGQTTIVRAGENN